VNVVVAVFFHIPWPLRAVDGFAALLCAVGAYHILRVIQKREAAQREFEAKQQRQRDMLAMTQANAILRAGWIAGATRSPFIIDGTENLAQALLPKAKRAEAIIAYRKWKIVEVGDVVFLQSIHYETPWPPGKPLRACNFSVDENCAGQTGGIYAYYNTLDTLSQGSL